MLLLKCDSNPKSRTSLYSVAADIDDNCLLLSKNESGNIDSSNSIYSFLIAIFCSVKGAAVWQSFLYAVNLHQLKKLY